MPLDAFYRLRGTHESEKPLSLSTGQWASTGSRERRGLLKTESSGATAAIEE